MRRISNFSAIFGLALAVAAGSAQAAPPSSAAQAATAPAAAQHLSSDSLVGDILDNPAAKAVLLKHVPQLDDQIEMARGMTLHDLQQYAPDTFTDDVYKKIDADLAKLPAK